MRSNELLADWVSTFTQGVHQAVAGLSPEELAWRPDAEGNSIGVTVWHCSRGLDVLRARFLERKPAEAEQWHTQGWTRKTGYDPRGIGSGGFGMLSGYTQEEVAAIPALSARELLTYLDQAAEALCLRLLATSGKALSQSAMIPGRDQTRYELIKGILLGCVGHLGEIEALNALQVRARQRTPERPVEKLTSLDKLEVVKRLFDAVHRRDPDSVLATYHPDIVIHEAPSLPYGGNFRGHQQALQHLNGYYQCLDAVLARGGIRTGDQEHDNVFIETTQDFVVVLWRVEALEPKTGARIELPEVGLYKVRQGKVVESWMFPQDTAAVMKFLDTPQMQK